MKISNGVINLAVALSKPIEVLDLSVLTYNSLRRWGVNSVADLCETRNDERLPAIRGIGKKGLLEIEHKLDDFLNEYMTDSRGVES